MKPIRTYEEYRRRFFPAEVERERLAKLTPEELGREWAKQAVAKALRILKSKNQ